MLSRSDQERIGKDYQAVKFPVFKDVAKQWNFNYAQAEKQRFKGELQWNCGVLSEEQVQQYLKTVSEKWPKKTGMCEEIALKLLVLCEYNILKTLSVLKEQGE